MIANLCRWSCLLFLLVSVAAQAQKESTIVCKARSSSKVTVTDPGVALTRPYDESLISVTLQTTLATNDTTRTGYFSLATEPTGRFAAATYEDESGTAAVTRTVSASGGVVYSIKTTTTGSRQVRGTLVISNRTTGAARFTDPLARVRITGLRCAGILRLSNNRSVQFGAS